MLYPLVRGVKLPLLRNPSAFHVLLRTFKQLLTCNCLQTACHHSIYPNSVIAFLHLQIHLNHNFNFALLSICGSKIDHAGRDRDTIAC